VAYEEAIAATSASHAPWYIIPADDKWYTRLAIAGIIYQQLTALKIDHPAVSEELRADLIKGRALLMKE
jgi:Polyphosphate kinase 2 (PPK2)